MPDREKVMRALKIHAEGNGYICQYCIEECCPYVNSPLIIGKRNCDISQMCIDALTLLKEQEAVKPVPPEDEFGLYRCGKCYHPLFRCVDRYCSRCGKAVKWE